MKGFFVTFEGPDGAGKTTQLQRLAERLQQTGIDVVTTREPGGTAISDKIREILLSPDHSEMMDQTEVLLYAASRAQHVHEVIIPSLRRGAVVICDRFIDASMAYQVHGLGQSEAAVFSINRYASSRLEPNRTYMLDVSAEIGRARITARASQTQGTPLDRIEQKDIDFHQRVREGFRRIAEENANRVFLVDANRSVDDIAADIYDDFMHTFQRHRLLGAANDNNDFFE